MKKSQLHPGSTRKPGHARPAETATVIVDDRERASKLDEAIGRICGVRPQIQRLQLGDVLIRSRILIERKAIEDFEASVIDGRLFRQIEGLQKQPFETVLILEGDPAGGSTRRLSPSAFRGALLSVSLDWRVPILRSRCVDDTARWIQAILRRGAARQEPPDWRWVTPTGQRREVRFRPVKKTLSPANLRHRQCLDMLRQISGLGRVRAEILLDRFGSISGIIEASKMDLSSVQGIGHRLAGQIHEILHEPHRSGAALEKSHGGAGAPTTAPELFAADFDIGSTDSPEAEISSPVAHGKTR